MCAQRRVRGHDHSEPRATPSDKPTGSASVGELDAEQLLAWAKGIARGVREDARFRAGSAEEEELEGTAIVALVELMHRFDELRLPPDGNLLGAFKGWAADEIRSRCRRHAATLRNGGTFRTTSNPEARQLRVRALPMCPDCNQVALAAPQPEDQDQDEESQDVIECKHEPVLVILRNGNRLPDLPVGMPDQSAGRQSGGGPTGIERPASEG
jgi:hypothetical protein